MVIDGKFLPNSADKIIPQIVFQRPFSLSPDKHLDISRQYRFNTEEEFYNFIKSFDITTAWSDYKERHVYVVDNIRYCDGYPVNWDVKVTLADVFRSLNTFRLGISDNSSGAETVWMRHYDTEMTFILAKDLLDVRTLPDNKSGEQITIKIPKVIHYHDAYSVDVGMPGSVCCLSTDTGNQLYPVLKPGQPSYTKRFFEQMKTIPKQR